MRNQTSFSGGSTRTSGVWLCLLLSGCSLVLEADGVQCNTREDCRLAGEETRLCSEQGRCVPTSAIQWGCVNDASSELAPGSVKVRVQFAAEQPFANLNVGSCELRAGTCEETGRFVTDADGRIELEVPGQETTWLDVLDPASPKTRVSLGPFRSGLGTVNLFVPMLAWNRLGVNNVTVPDPDLAFAQIVAMVIPCDSWGPSNASLSFAGAGIAGEGPFYIRSRGLSGSTSRTDETGVAVFMNLESAAGDSPFEVELVAEEADSKLPIASVEVLAETGFATYVYFDPLLKLASE